MDKGIKLQAYKQRHGHDINGVRPVMIPDESGDWVSRFDAEHLAEQLVRAKSRIAELEANPKCVKLPRAFGLESLCQVRLLNYADTVAAIRAAGGTVEGSE